MSMVGEHFPKREQIMSYFVMELIRESLKMGETIYEAFGGIIGFQVLRPHWSVSEDHIDNDTVYRWVKLATILTKNQK
jgi:hypothetical protein